MLVNWKPFILNAFDFHLSNGFQKVATTQSRL